MSKSWEDVRSVLDDPYVSADTKEALLAAYVRENGDDASSEVEDYTDGTKAQYDLEGDIYPYAYQSTDDIYGTAQDESDEAGYSARLNNESVEEGRTNLEDMQAPTEDSGSSAVQTSDEIFDEARPSLRIFEDFLPVNDKVPGDQLGRYGKIKLEDIQKRFDEQMGISFKNFLDDAARLRSAYGTLNDLNGSTETELNTLYKKWTGPAANASFQHWSEKLSPPVKELLDYLETGPDMIGTAVTNIFTACKDKANDVIALYQGLNGTMGSATPDMAMKVVNLANGDFGEEDHDKILEVAAWVDASTGSNLESTIRSDDCDLNEENRDYVISECKKWIRDSFNADLHENLYVNFKQACDDALEAVDSHYETLNNYLKEYENEFGEAPPPGSQNPPPGSQNPPPGSENPPPGSSNPPPGSSGPPPGSSGPPPGSSSPPPGSSPPPSSPPPIDTPPPGSEDPTDPNKPEDDTGDPTDPGTPGTPGTGDDQEETVTINDGDHEISVTSPDGQGMVKVTVDDGSGQPKSYTLDFGATDPVTPGQPGQPTPPGQDGVTGEPGQNGEPPTVPGPDEPIEPGPDGKCVITDGDLTITAERPEGQSDTVVVTVDDGTGEPTTYNLDYSEGTDPTATPQTPGRPESPGQPMPAELVDANEQVDQADFTPGPDGEQISTQPAPGEMPAQGDVSTQPAPGEMPVQGDVSTQPAYGEMPAQLQQDQPQQHAFATTPAAANDPIMSGAGGDQGVGDRAGSFGGPHQEASPYMHGASGEAGLPVAPDAPVDQSGQGQAHPGMAGGMLGGAPGGGGMGGDSERPASQWRTTGDLFDEPADPEQLRRAFGGN